MHRTVPILSLAILLCHALHVVPAESNEPSHAPQGEQTREALAGPDGSIDLGEMGYLDVVGKEIVDLEWKLLQVTVAHSKSMSLDTLIPSHADKSPDDMPPDDKTPADKSAVDTGLSDVCVLDQPTLDALVKQLPNHGSIKTIASSKTVTVSGGTTSATFGDSLELSIPPAAEGGDANRTVQRMPLGTMLEITPTGLLDDGVRLDFRLRTRHANSSNSVVVNDQRIPGLSTSFIARSVSVKGSGNVVALLRTAQTAADSDQPATYLLAIMQAAVPNSRTEPDVP